MGYTTEFQGKFKLDKPLSVAHKAYLEAFSGSRRMKRDPKKTKELPDTLREDVGLDVGVDGEFYVESYFDGNFGQGKNWQRSNDIIDYNSPPKTQPGLWCQWVPTEDGSGIEWSGQEKFYDYVEWLAYLIDNFIKPWGYVLNGKVKWRGEDFEDSGQINVNNNVITTT